MSFLGASSPGFSTSEYNDEESGRLTLSVEMMFGSSLTLVLMSSLLLKTFFINVRGFLMKEPPRFFLGRSRLIEPDVDLREGVDVRPFSSTKTDSALFDELGFKNICLSVFV